MIIALDVGTSSARASVWNEEGRPAAGRFHQVAYRARVTADGGAELDAGSLLDAVAACIDAVLAGGPRFDVSAVGIATFWHGLLGFDASSAAVTPIHLWADTRSADDAAMLRGALDEELVRRRTGCYLHPSFWPAKLRWFARTRGAEAARVARWGSVGEHLELALFGEASTSLSIASATGLLEHERARWDAEAVAASGIEERQLFPLVDRTAARRGLLPSWSRRWPALRTAAWFPAVGDGAASSIGSARIGLDRIVLNLGTSAALRIVRPAAPVPSRGLWRYRLDGDLAVVGGATSEGGNVYAWCADTLRLPAEEQVERALATRAPGADDLVALPFLAGERAPGWRVGRRAAITRLTLDSTPIDILGAMLEAVALRLTAIYDLLAPDAAPDHVIIGSGGGAERSPAWLQMIADAIGRPIVKSREPEATSRGVALLTLDAIGALPLVRAPEPPAADIVTPDAARHAQYREALARQRTLDQAL